MFGHALHADGSDDVPSFTEHLGDVAAIVAPYACADLVLADRHTYEVAANWKVVAENYHECYHCPLIHPELCAVTPAGLAVTTTTCPAPGSAARCRCATGWPRCR